MAHTCMYGGGSSKEGRGVLMVCVWEGSMLIIAIC